MGVSKRYTKCFLFNYILDEHVKSTENTPRSGYDEVCIYASRQIGFKVKVVDNVKGDDAY